MIFYTYRVDTHNNIILFFGKNRRSQAMFIENDGELSHHYGTVAHDLKFMKSRPKDFLDIKIIYEAN